MANPERSSAPAAGSSAPRLYAAVAVPLPLAAPLTYAVPPEMAPALEAGVRVRVPLARREVTGYVVGFPPEAPPVRL
ncbi:MAG: hypothetical protein HY575_04970, partial [candidate division NC10 bacterium]|nr:hypothetical protein [candidate division NC10 bacterium]